MILAFNAYDGAKLLAFIAVPLMIGTALLYVLGFALLPFLGLMFSKYWYVSLILAVVGLVSLINILVAPKGKKRRPAFVFMLVWVVSFAITMGGLLLVEHQKVEEGRLVYALSVQGEQATWDTQRGWVKPNDFLQEIMPNWDRLALKALRIREGCLEDLSNYCYPYTPTPEEIPFYRDAADGPREFQVDKQSDIANSFWDLNYVYPLAMNIALQSPWAAAHECLLPAAGRPAVCETITGIEQRYNIEILKPMMAHLKETGKTCREVKSCAKLQQITGETITVNGTAKADAGLVAEAPNFAEFCQRIGRETPAFCSCVIEGTLKEKGSETVSQLEAIYTRRQAATRQADVTLSAAEQALEDSLFEIAEVCRTKAG